MCEEGPVFDETLLLMFINITLNLSLLFVLAIREKMFYKYTHRNIFTVLIGKMFSYIWELTQV